MRALRAVVRALRAIVRALRAVPRAALPSLLRRYLPQCAVKLLVPGIASRVPSLPPSMCHNAEHTAVTR